MIASLKEFVRDCHEKLMASPTDEVGEAFSYLTKERGLDTKGLSNHMIGYCPFQGHLPHEVRYFGETPDTNDGRSLDCSNYIKGRIILPIFSEFGQIVGISTRNPSTKQGNTWWNLPRPFEKSCHIFLLDKTREAVFTANKIYLVEGYLDGIVLLEQGLKNVGCIMGINLTVRQIGLIARYCNNVCLCMDVDSNQSGQNAQEKLTYILNEFSFCDNLSMIDGLPVGQDPDKYVLKNGLKSFLDLEKPLSRMDIKKICKRVRDRNGNQDRQVKQG